MSHLLSAPTSGPAGRSSRRARKGGANLAPQLSAGEESSKVSKKKGRKWDADGLADEEGDIPLDYSATSNGAESQDGNRPRPGAMDAVDQRTWGSKTRQGEFVLRDLDDEVHSILSSAGGKKAGEKAPSGVVGSSLGVIGGLFRNVVGGRVLTKADLEKPMKGMEEHLLRKNVAREAAVRLCEGVEKSLVGVKTGSFQSQSHHLTSCVEGILTSSYRHRAYH